MDLQRHLGRSHVAITLREQLVELMDTDLGDSTRAYLIAHPQLVSSGATELLDGWYRRAIDRDDAATAEWVLWHQNLLRIVWPLCLCVPLSTPPTTKAFPELTQQLAELGIHSPHDLSQRVQVTRDLRQRLIALALEHVSAPDWEVIVLVAASTAGSHALAWIQEHQDLLGYEAELTLNVYHHWAAAESQTFLQELLDRAHALLGHVRQEVQTGRLRLHNVPVLRLMQEFVGADSWEESIAILRDHPELLTDEGVDELASCLQSAFAGAILGRSAPGLVARYTMHLTLVDLARTSGLETAYDALPVMPPALWLVAGMLRVVRRGDDTWDALSSWLSSQPAAVEPMAHVLRLAGILAEQTAGGEPICQEPVADGEIAQITLLALLQHMLRSPASHALALAVREAGTLWRPEVANILEPLRPDRDDSVAALCDALSALARGRYGLVLMRLLDQYRLADLDMMVPNGSSLLLLVGRITQLANLQADDVPVEWWGDPCWEGVAASRLLEHVIAHGPKDLGRRLRPSLPFLEQTARLSGMAAVQARLSEGLDPTGMGAAVTAWGFAPDRAALRAVVERYPVLLTADADPHVRGIVDFTRDSGDPAALEHAQERYAWLLDIRRDHLEAKEGLGASTRAPNDPEPIVRLIRELEIAIPLRKWLPVSRIDLSDAFFDRLDRQIGEVEDRLGAGHALLLHEVAEHARRWRSQFGSTGSEHTAAIAEFLTALLHASDDAELYAIVADNVVLAEGQAAADILSDWLVVAEDLSAANMLDRLRDRAALLDAVRRSSMDVAFLARSGGASPESVSRLSQALGLGHCEDIVAVVEAARDAPLDVLLSAGERVEESLRRHGRRDVDALAADMRFHALALRIQDAFASGAEAYMRYLMSEPLLSDPTVASAVEAVLQQQPPEVRDLTTWFLRFQADPVLRALLLGDIRDDQKAELQRLDGLLVSLVVAPTWRERFDLLALHGELRTERSVLWAEWYGLRMRAQAQGSSGPSEVGEMALQLWQEVSGFLRRCLEVGLDDAITEKSLALSGIPSELETKSVVRLFSHLTAEQAGELDATRDTYPYVLSRLAASEDLGAEDRATAQGLLAMFHKVQYERNRERAALDRAVADYRLAVAMSPSEGSDKAVRRRWLAASLLARFQHYGDEGQDLLEAIEVLRAALQMPVVDGVRTQLLGELGRALSMRGEATNTAGDVREAVSVLEEAIRTSSPGSEHWMGWHLNLGAAWSTLAEMIHEPEAWARAEEVYREALAAGEPEPSLAFSLRHNLANVRRYWGEARHSLEALDGSLRAYEHLDSESLPDEERASLYFSMGSGWMSRHAMVEDRESLDTAIACFRRALQLLDGSTPDAAMCRNNLAIALQQRAPYTGNQDVQEAMTIYQEILSAPLASSWPHLVVTAAENYGNYCLRRSAFQQARTVYETGLSALDRLRQAATAQEDRLRHAEEYAALYGRLVHCCLKLGDVPAALEHAQSSKARAFAHQLAVGSRMAEAHDPLLVTLQREASDVQARLADQRKALETDGPHQSAGDNGQLRAEIRSLQEREARLLQRIADLQRYEQIGTAERVSVAGLETIQTELSQVGAIALEYYRDVAGWGVFVVSPQKVEHVRLAPHDPPWQAWIGGVFAPDYRPRDAETVHGVLREIDNFFVAPLRAHLPARGTPLVLAPTELMSVLPLTAALAPDGHHLLDHHPITTVPSSHLYRHRPVRTFTSVLAASHPGLAGTRSYIPFSRVEADVIGASFTKARELHGSELTCETLAGLAGRHDIVHLACHGFVDWQHPESSGLVLPEGQWLTVLDLLHRTRFEGPSLVVLSACDVGLEMPRPGDEHVSLVRAFALAGVPTVVASLWSVNDISTMLLMRRFYSQLTQATGSVAEALREAQRWLRSAEEEEVLGILEAIEGQLRDSGQERLSLDVFRGRLAVMALKRECPFAHPYYWAGFQAYGSAL